MVDKYFELVSHVKKFVISGGEPLLHNQLPEFIFHLLQYEDRINLIELITNGTIIPNEDVIIQMKKTNKMDVLVDDYGPDLSVHISEVSDILSKNNITYRIRKYYGNDAHCGGWVDFNDHSFKGYTQEELENCALRRKSYSTFTIIGGEIHCCVHAPRRIELGVIPKNQEEYIDLFDESIYEDKIKTFKSMLDRKAFTSCAYCSGLRNNAKRFPPAEQVS
jgi:MoaA/NifB/PqqE/SkfB family radical SAM enzyme